VQTTLPGRPHRLGRDALRRVDRLWTTDPAAIRGHALDDPLVIAGNRALGDHRLVVLVGIIVGVDLVPAWCVVAGREQPTGRT